MAPIHFVVVYWTLVFKCALYYYFYSFQLLRFMHLISLFIYVCWKEQKKINPNYIKLNREWSAVRTRITCVFIRRKAGRKIGVKREKEGEASKQANNSKIVIKKARIFFTGTFFFFFYLRLWDISLRSLQSCSLTRRCGRRIYTYIYYYAYSLCLWAR